MRGARVVSVEPAVLASNAAARLSPGEPAIVLARFGEGSLRAHRVRVEGFVEQANGCSAFVVLDPGAVVAAYDASGAELPLPCWALPDED